MKMEDKEFVKKNGNQSNKHREIRNVTLRFSIFAAGFILICGPYMAVIGLQSSMNMEENIGTSSLGIGYAVSTTFSIFFVPTLTRRFVQNTLFCGEDCLLYFSSFSATCSPFYKLIVSLTALHALSIVLNRPLAFFPKFYRFGTKFVLIIGEFCYSLFVAANFYPVLSVMKIAGVSLGLAHAAVWSNVQLFNTYFGRHQSKFGTNYLSSYVQKYTGLFFGSFQFGQILGNLCSYAILQGTKVLYNDTDAVFESTTAMANWNSTFVHQPKRDYYLYCGANDCQNPNVTSAQKDRYVPDQLSIYILLGVFCSFCLCGLLLHIRFLPEPTARGESTKVGKDVIQDKDNNANERRILRMNMKKTLVGQS